MSLDDFIDDCSNPEKLENVNSILDENLTIDDLDALAYRLTNITDMSEIYRESGHDDSKIYEDLKSEIKAELCKLPSIDLEEYINIKKKKVKRKKSKKSRKKKNRKSRVLYKLQ